MGKLIDLPRDEIPTIALVSNINQLPKDSFFAKAQNGDWVILYKASQKAILYRPGQKKIIEYVAGLIGPIGSANPATTVKEQKVYKVGVLNGTTTPGLAKSYAAKLLDQVDKIEIVERTNASRDDHRQTLVVNITNAPEDIATSLLKVVGGKIGELPQGEEIPSNVDILIILGTN